MLRSNYKNSIYKVIYIIYICPRVALLVLDLSPSFRQYCLLCFAQHFEWLCSLISTWLCLKLSIFFVLISMLNTSPRFARCWIVSTCQFSNIFQQISYPGLWVNLNLVNIVENNKTTYKIKNDIKCKIEIANNVVTVLKGQ